MFRHLVATVIALIFALAVGTVAGVLLAQVQTSQPYVCLATVDLTYTVPTWQKAYAVTGTNCPIGGQLWVISDTDTKGTIYLVGGPK